MLTFERDREIKILYIRFIQDAIQGDKNTIPIFPDGLLDQMDIKEIDKAIDTLLVLYRYQTNQFANIFRDPVAGD